MSADTSSPTPQRLYKQWREGDAASGQAMAQRFSDWYYAVTASRLGDAQGRGPLQRACTRFQQGIVGVQNPAELVDWAHGILADEIHMAGGRTPGGDFPNQLTSGRSPSDLLNIARVRLDAEDVEILAHAYDTTFPIERLRIETQSRGGMTVAVLRARYRLKRALRDVASVPLVECPDEPNLDYAPLPLYEAGRMTNAAEESGFEKWVLSDLSLCRDIAEFGVFALSLRSGAYAAALAEIHAQRDPITSPRPLSPPPAAAAPAPAPAAPAITPPAPAPAPAAPAPAAEPLPGALRPADAPRGNMMPFLVIGLVLGALALVAAVAGAWALGFLGG